MKTSLQKQRVSSLLKSLLSLRKMAVSSLLTTLCLLGLSLGSYSQQVLQLDETIAQMLASGNPELVEQGNNLQSLVYDLHSTVYARSGQLTNPLGGIPLVCDSDVASLWQLYEPNYLFNQVELLIVKIQQPGDLSSFLNLTNLEGFSNLKYLLFVCKFYPCQNPDPACEISLISQMISGSNESIEMILYQVSISN